MEIENGCSFVFVFQLNINFPLVLVVSSANDGTNNIIRYGLNWHYFDIIMYCNVVYNQSK